MYYVIIVGSNYARHLQICLQLWIFAISIKQNNKTTIHHLPIESSCDLLRHPGVNGPSFLGQVGCWHLAIRSLDVYSNLQSMCIPWEKHNIRTLTYHETLLSWMVSYMYIYNYIYIYMQLYIIYIYIQLYTVHLYTPYSWLERYWYVADVAWKSLMYSSMNNSSSKPGCIRHFPLPPRVHKIL